MVCLFVLLLLCFLITIGWCYDLSAASSSEIETSCNILHKNADLEEFSVISKTEILTVNMICHNFGHS